MRPRVGGIRRASGAFAWLALMLLAGGVAVAQDSVIDTDEDSLFGSPEADATGEDAVDGDLFGDADGDLFGGSLVTDIEETETDISSILLTSEAVQIGGRYAMDLNAGVSWDDLATVPENLFDPDSTSLRTSLSTQLYFDARPDEDFRVFGKMTVSYPFEEVVQVNELFSDFNWNDTVFFRGGKQTVNWGVGYFYSPADLLSISEVDPEDPEAEREGPVSLKVNVPIDVHNLYLYAMPAFADEPLDIGLAAKGEVVVGSTEFTAGAIYQRDIAPAGMITVSTHLGDVDLFAEGVLSYGSNRTYVREIATPPFVETYIRDGEFIPSASAGLSYSAGVGDDAGTFMLISQYLYNGEGYADAALLSDNQAGVMALVAAGDLGLTDLQSTGRHYSATSVNWGGMFGSEFSSGVFWMQNYSDMSAMITPSLSVTVLDAIDLSLQVPIRLGEAGDEFAPGGNAVSVNLGIGLGGGSF